MVFLAKDITNGDLVAIKCLSKSPTDKACLAASGNDHLLELACHDRLGYHPNIVNLIHAFETGAHMYLVLEFCSMGDLYEAIRLSRGPLQTEHVRGFMLQLVNAVEFMHTNGLFHRDIKPENIFLAQDGSMKLGDFGLSTTETWTFEASVGSDRYMAPEQYDPADIGYSPAHADIWAIGICLLNILFCRNPFVTPSESDVLFADFVRDKQSLFDVFPNMSQDTFEVLVHALAIEPHNRSLSGLREALNRVISFTTDDEVLDDFCTEDREVVPASANRLPLRTPSIQSPPIEQGGAFPWAKALHMSPPPASVRQLSTIHDTEHYDDDDLFPETQKPTSPWYSISAQTPSLASVLDSALGASVKSMNFRQPKPRNKTSSNATPICGSLPMTTSKPIPAISSVFGGKDNTVSKSWSDMWDEDEEEETEDARRHFNGLNWSSESVDEDLTIRCPDRSVAKDSSATDPRTQSLPNIDTDSINKARDYNMGLYEHLPKTAYQLPTYSPPSKRTIMDKWAALGNRRRAFDLEAASKEKEETGRKRTSTGGIWRRGFGSGFGMKMGSGNVISGARPDSGVWERRCKNKDVSDGGVRIRDWRRDHQVQRYHYGKESSSGEDESDLEWVGGWNDLHV
ncbi:hypothetical protein MMC19_006704 [Ptychographa xylographoides]|nr:hypothetical protein [Ptychographa xylographoides]